MNARKLIFILIFVLLMSLFLLTLVNQAGAQDDIPPTRPVVATEETRTNRRECVDGVCRDVPEPTPRPTVEPYPYPDPVQNSTGLQTVYTTPFYYRIRPLVVNSMYCKIVENKPWWCYWDAWDYQPWR